MKRMMAMMLALVLALTMPAAAAVEVDDYSGALAMSRLGLYDDVLDTGALSAAITRGEGTALLMRLIGGAHAAPAGCRHPFTDVPDELRDAVAWAYTNGLTRGISETEFAPEAPMTRTMFLTMLFRALGYRDGVDFDWAEAEQLCRWAGLEAEEDDGAFTLSDALALTRFALRCVPVDQEVTDGIWMRLAAQTAGTITGDAAAVFADDILGPTVRMNDRYGNVVEAASELRTVGIGGAFTDPAVERFPLSLTFDGQTLALPDGAAAYRCRIPGVWSVYHATYVPLTATLEALGFRLYFDRHTGTLSGTTQYGELSPVTGEAGILADAAQAELKFCRAAFDIVLDGRAVDFGRYLNLKADGVSVYEEALLMMVGWEYYIPLDLLARTLGVGTDGEAHLFSERLTKYTYPNNSAVYRDADGQYILLWGGETLRFSGLPGAEVAYFDWHDERGSGVFDTVRLQLVDASGRRENHVIDLLAMKHVSSTLYDYVELAAQPAWGITLRGVVAPHWGNSGNGMYCNHFALTVGERTVWFEENALMMYAYKPGGGVSLAMRDEGRTVEITLCTQMRSDGMMEDFRVIGFDCETLERLY